MSTFFAVCILKLLLSGIQDAVHFMSMGLKVDFKLDPKTAKERALILDTAFNALAPAFMSEHARLSHIVLYAIHQLVMWCF